VINLIAESGFVESCVSDALSKISSVLFAADNLFISDGDRGELTEDFSETQFIKKHKLIKRTNLRIAVLHLMIIIAIYKKMMKTLAKEEKGKHFN
jgi:hypothetical protein